ncbi:MAG: HtaA domain-containing protein [Pseudomonadales bacterium]|nr:HtaA domain-containing protein [Pseudomonadales bacterium]MDG1442848.1 HtaA domain-containing protein [Pseudomonadales bacterium]
MSFNRLIWGVKASFRRYVEAAGGSSTLADGARSTEDGSFIFMAVPGGDLTIAADGSATGAMRFQGSVSFEAHGGMLKATLAELGIEAGPDGLVLTVLEYPQNEDRCAIAQLGPVEVGDGNVMTIRSEITFDGMYQIADNYPQGTELDPLILD